MKKLRWASVLIVIILAFGLVSCTTVQEPADTSSDEAASASEPAVEEQITLRLLTLSTDENRIKIMNEYIKPKIESEFPNVTVEFEEGGGGEDYNNKVKTYNSTGDLPDVWYSDATFASATLQAGNMLDLTPFITEDGFLDKCAVPDAMQYKGGIYSLGSGGDTYFTPRIFYNKAIFEECGVTIPTTFDELIEVCKTIKAKGYTPVATVGKGGWAPKLFLFQAMVTIEDPQVMQDLLNNETDFTNPVVYNALDRIDKLAEAGAFPEGIALVDYGPAKELFTSGEAAMYWMFTWELPSLDALEDIDVDFFTWPSAGAAYDPNTAIQYWGSPVNGYAVNSKSEHIEAAVKLAEFCAMQDALFYQDNGTLVTLDTGKEMTGQSELMIRNIDQFKGCSLKLASLTLNGMDAATNAEFETLGASLLTGEFSAAEFVEEFQPIWESNTYFD